MLYHIKCYFDMSYEQKYTEKNMWEGNMFLKDNVFFEGIVSNKITKSEALIFGIYYEGNVIQIYKVNSTFIGKPTRIDARFDDGNYEGNFYTLDLFGQTICGNCKISITERKLEEPNGVKEVFFQKKLDYLINQKLDAIARDFYLRMKQELCLNEEELKKIMNCSPVNKNLMDERTYYKLTRKKINIFQPNEFK